MPPPTLPQQLANSYTPVGEERSLSAGEVGNSFLERTATTNKKKLAVPLLYRNIFTTGQTI